MAVAPGRPALTGALLLAVLLSTSQPGCAKPLVSDLEFQSLLADYTYCVLKESDRLALTTQIATAAVFDAGIAACATKRRALLELMTRIGKHAHANDKAIADVSALFGASVDADLRPLITKQIIAERAMQK